MSFSVSPLNTSFSSSLKTGKGFGKRPDPAFKDFLNIRFGINGSKKPLAQQIMEAQSSPLSTRTKLKKTQQEAYTLFTKHQDNPQGLLNELENHGVKVYYADEDPGAEAFLKFNTSYAMYSRPFQVVFPNERISPKDFPKIPEPQAAAFSEKLEKDGITFISSRQPFETESLFHETFHLLQDLNGLPFGTSLSDYVALKKMQLEIHTKNPHFPFVVNLSTFDKWLGIPLKKRHRGFQKMMGQKLNSPAETMRMEAQRELEVVRFLLKHHQLFGFSEDILARNTWRKTFYKKAINVSYMLNKLFSEYLAQKNN